MLSLFTHGILLLVKSVMPEYMYMTLDNHAYRLESADKKIATTAFFNTFCKVIKENAKKPADIQQLLQHV